jgi:uncharacterized protein YuzE
LIVLSPRLISNGPKGMITTSYDPEADAVYVRIAPKSIEITGTREVEPGVILDMDANGRLVGIEVLGVRGRSTALTTLVA